jgi:hypothetical protein
MLNRSQQALFELLKVGIRNDISNEMFFVNLSEAEWKDTYNLAIKQGVMSIVFDSMMRLPEEKKPPRSLKINWALNVECLEKKYEKYCIVVHEIADIFEKNKVKMFLFKGLSLAQLYPTPSHREFGDLDIYLFDKCKKGTQVLLKHGLTKEYSSSKHVSLSYKGISIENHKAFLNLYQYPYLRNLNNELTRLSDNNLETNFHNDVVFPNPDFNLLYIMAHAVLHFPTCIVLRYLCDWTVLLESNKGKFDFISYTKSLSCAGLLTVADAFTALAVRFLGLNPELAPAYNSNPDLENKILYDILNPIVLKEKSSSRIEIFKYKCQLLKSRRWKYELIKGGFFNEKVLRSAFFYLFHPGLIFKI